MTSPEPLPPRDLEIAAKLRSVFVRWRDDLINLDKRNRLLYYRPYPSSTVEILQPNPDHVARTLLQGTWGWDFYAPLASEVPEEQRPKPRPSELVTDRTDANALRLSLQRIDRRTQQAYMDSGVWLLYLAIGMLEWKEPDEGESASSPILLIPARLDRPSPRDPYRLVRAEAEPVLNPALAVKLEADWGIALPNLADIEDLSLDTVLGTFETGAASHPDWSIKRRMVLSTFSFHKMAMYRDLLENEYAILSHGAIRALALGPEGKVSFAFPEISDSQLDKEVPPENLVSILDADSSQRRAIKAAMDGRSFLMHGPPGTGKSQTIANVIAELMFRGKSVLFVSEKAAALEVVHSRLAAKGLASYVLALHSDRATRKEVAAELGRALTLQPAGVKQLPLSEVKRAYERRLELSGYAQSVNELRVPLRTTVQFAFGRLSELKGLPRMPWWSGQAKNLDPEAFEGLLDTARALSRAWGPVERQEEFLWRHTLAKRFDLSLRNAAEAEAETAASSLKALVTKVAALNQQLGLSFATNERGLEALQAVLRLLHSRPEHVPAHWLTAPKAESVRERMRQLEGACAAVLALRQALEARAGTRYRELDVGAAQRLDASVTALHRLPSPVDVDAKWPAARLRAVADFCSRGLDQLRLLRPTLEQLADDFGVPRDRLTVARARALAELATKVGSHDLPEPAWLSPVRLPAVQQAVVVLQEVVTQFNARAADLSQVFNPGVLQLDLESLVVRFGQVYKGPFKFLNGSYRADKKLVASATRAGRVDQIAIQKLPEALELQRLRARLGHEENRHAPALGGHYYSSNQTDFQAITSAIDIARLALEAVGHDLDGRVVSERIGFGAVPDPAVYRRGMEALVPVTDWLAQAAHDLGGEAAHLTHAPLAKVLESLAKAGEHLAALVATLQAAEGVAGRPLTLYEVADLLIDRANLEYQEAALAGSESVDRDLLGARYQRERTRWADLDAAVGWTEALLAAVGRAPEPTLVRLLNETPDRSGLEIASANQRHALKALGARFEEPWRKELLGRVNADYVAGAELLERLHESTAEIDEWIAYITHHGALTSAGFGAVLAEAEALRVHADQVPDLIERSLYEGWLESILATDDRLKLLRAVDRDQRVDEFRELDRQLIKGSVGRIIDACNARRPRSATLGEAAIIAREATKKKRHMPVRTLLSQTAAVTRALKPCFMMSPLTVSQFLTPDFHFDAVIFDEASQVKPADAINAIYRGSQLMVAGDVKQLPPSNFFEESTSSNDDDEYNEDDVAVFESVLDLAKGSGAFPSIPLLWHYRSQHEGLIAFSNKHFYDGTLFTFPGAVQVAPDLGLELYRVPGTYRRSTSRDNPVEAAKVAERVLYHLEHHPHLTIGVVTFSEAQQEAVDEAVNRMRATRRDLDHFFKADRLNGFFVKNLETVQGDERDIIIFSVGYGKDENGRFLLNLGPLTRAGGERRLNVAVTRARRRVELIASVAPTDFIGQMSEDGGVWHLCRYLDYVQRGGAVEQLPDETHRTFDSPLEAEVARTVQSWGYDAVPQVGTARFRVDIGVRIKDQRGRFILGVECDGAMYHSSPVARDRDRLRAEILTGLGWKLHRIWSPAWYRDRASEERRLKAAIEAAAEAPVEVVKRGDLGLSTPAEGFEYEELETDADRSWTTEYQVGKLQRGHVYCALHAPEASPEIRRMVLELASVEAPVSIEVALRRVREAWGVGRAGDRIWARFNQELKFLEYGRKLTLRGGFIWLPSQELTLVRIPGQNPDSNRRVTEVAPEEIDLAVAHISVDAIGAAHDDLGEAAARTFGWQRRGPDIQEAISASMARLTLAKKLEDRNGRLYWIGGELPNHGSRGTGRRVRLESPAHPTWTPPSIAPPTGPQRQTRLTAPPPRAATPQRVQPSQISPPAHSTDGRPLVPADVQRCLTQSGVAKKTQQVERWQAERAEVARKIESGGWGDATDERERHELQGNLTSLDNRIRETTSILRGSRVLAPPGSTQYAVLGTLVTIQDEDGPEEIYQLVGPLEADVAELRISVTSPLGTALYGREKGELVRVQNPNGTDYSVTIRDIRLP